MPFDKRALKASVYANGRKLELDGYDMYLDSVELTNSREPNLAKLIVYNLGAANRGILSGEHQALTISAASDICPTPTKIFDGQTMTVKHVRPTKASPRWETWIEAADSIKVYKGAWVSNFWGAGTPISVVVSDIAFDMGVPFDCRVSGTLRGDWAFNGRAADALSELSWDYGARWVLYQGTLEFLLATDSIDRSSQLAVTVSSDSGMVGSPTIVERQKKGGRRRFGVSVKTLMNPRLRPNGLIKIESASQTAGIARTKKGQQYQTPGANGVFRIERLTHYGSLITPDFYTEFETRSFDV
jgi:hypothetical protein